MDRWIDLKGIAAAAIRLPPLLEFWFGKAIPSAPPSFFLSTSLAPFFSTPITLSHTLSLSPSPSPEEPVSARTGRRRRGAKAAPLTYHHSFEKKTKKKDQKKTSKPDHAETVTLLAMPDFFWFFFCCCSISRSSVVLALISSFQQASKQRLGSQPKYTHTHTHTHSVSLSLCAYLCLCLCVFYYTTTYWGHTQQQLGACTKAFPLRSSSSSANRSSPNFFSFYSIRSSTRHLLASAQASSSILGFFFLSFACFLAATSADLLEELRNPARAAAGATAAATAGERERERERDEAPPRARPGWLRKDEALPRAPGLARTSSAGARARSGGRTGGRADGGVWDPVPGNWNQQQQRVSGTNPPAQ